MNFILRGPALRDSFWETVDFRDVLLDLTQVAWLVEGLKGCMFPIEVGFPVDSASQGRAVISEATTCLEVHYADELLV